MRQCKITPHIVLVKFDNTFKSVCTAHMVMCGIKSAEFFIVDLTLSPLGMLTVQRPELFMPVSAREKHPVKGIGKRFDGLCSYTANVRQ